MDLIHLLNRVQRHTMCGDHCLRVDKNTGKKSCRYKFPKARNPESIIEESEGCLTFIPKRDDEYIQRYNYIITSIWRANTDFSPIVSVDAVIRLVIIWGFIISHVSVGGGSKNL